MIIPHNCPTLGHEETLAAARVLSSGWIAQGEEVLALEHEFGNYLNAPAENIVAVSSGSAALYISLMIANARNKTVHAPAYSCRSIFNAIQLSGSLPAFLDVEESSVNSPLEDKNVDIAIVAHMFGIPECSVIKNRTSFLIEDASQTLGATIRKIKVGLFGEIGIFSLGATKIITSGGQGGIIVTKDKNLSDLARKIRDYDSIVDAIPRFNFQMTDLQAAIAREQLKKLPEFIVRRKHIFKKYQEAGIPLIDGTSHEVKPVRFRAVIYTDYEKVISCQNALFEHGIRAIIPVTENELLTTNTLVPNATDLSKKTLSIPIYPSLSDDDTNKIISVCTRALKL